MRFRSFSTSDIAKLKILSKVFILSNNAASAACALTTSLFRLLSRIASPVTLFTASISSAFCLASISSDMF